MLLQEHHGYQKQQVTPSTAGTPATAVTQGQRPTSAAAYMSSAAETQAKAGKHQRQRCGKGSTSLIVYITSAAAQMSSAATSWKHQQQR